MQKVRVEDLTGQALDWAVADALGMNPVMNNGRPHCDIEDAAGKQVIPKWSMDPVASEKLIDQCRIAVGKTPGGFVAAVMTDRGSATITASHRRSAACRSLVAARFGAMAEVPEVLA